MVKEDIYRRLSEAYNALGSKYLPKILKMYLTREEALVLSCLPGIPSEVAERLGASVSRVTAVLKQLFSKGLVLYDLVDDKTRYTLNLNLLDAVLTDERTNEFNEEFFNLWDKYYDQEISHMFDEDTPYNARVIPVERSIRVETEILPYEKASEIIKNAKDIAVIHCPCRRRSRRCDNPTEVCIVLENTVNYVTTRGVGRKISEEEALSILSHCEDLGLVHETNNASHGLQFICNCCSCCCVFLRGLIHLGRKYATTKSRYRSFVDDKLCNGCGVCITRCHFGAMKITNSKAAVDTERCFGCGLCASKCPTNAIALVQVRTIEHIPLREAPPLIFTKHENEGVATRT